MTRIQIHFRLRQPLDDAMMTKLSDASAIYGIQKVKLGSGSLMVEYDASRLRPAEVEAALAQAGIAAERT
jgi:allophanate hydrolase subunit 1